MAAKSRNSDSGRGRIGHNSTGRNTSAAKGESKRASQSPCIEKTRVASGRAGTLNIVATPIGNARDITLRALDMLGTAAMIACEDTRVTGKLLAIHGIKTPMVSYHEYNAPEARPKIIEKLKSGYSVALVSDAGTPLISDPGYKLVEACIEESIPVTALPGPSSVLCALALAGLPTDAFMFSGFLPSKTTARRKALRDLAVIPASLVFLENAKRLAASLGDMASELGPRPAAMLREMTKVHEEAVRGSLDDLARHYAEAGPPKGEVVVVVGPPPETDTRVSDDDLDAMIKRALETDSLKDAAKAIQSATGLPRKTVYNRAVTIKNAADDGDGGSD